MRSLAFSGSLRSGSFNRKLLGNVIRAAEAQGMTVEHLDLRELALPIYDGDIEARGLPDGAKQFKEKITAADLLLIASPEYNSSISGALKNAIDWASRPPENPFKGKLGSLFATSPGPFGGVRGLFTTRQILTVLGVWVSPNQLILPHSHQAFNDDGTLKEAKVFDQISSILSEISSLRGTK